MQPIVDSIWNFGSAHLATGLTGALATFFGASVAFFVERWKARKAQMVARRADMLEVQMILMCHANSLEDERRKIEPLRGLPDRERRMPEIVHTFDAVQIDVRKVSFLLDGSDPNLVMDVYMAEMCYLNACRALQVRNEKLKAFQSTLTVENFDLSTGVGGGRASLPDLKILRDATDAVFDCLDHALASQMSAMKKLREHARLLFPKTKFPLLQFDHSTSSNKTKHEPAKEG